MSISSNLEYIITHVFLPPKLPQEDDSDPKQDLALIKEFRAALGSCKARLHGRERRRWVAPILMLSKMLELRNASGDMLSEKVELSLEAMKSTDVLALHIHSQNAGLIVRRLPQQFSFESFELSPTNHAVMATKGRLRRYFPGPAVAVDLDRLAEPSFRKALAQLLAGLDVNTPKEAWPVVVKAHSQTPEIRDSLHPKFITEMLTGILRGIGQPVDVVRIHKRIRDDVLWKNALKPWRRSPLWLLLRVALQTSLRTEADDRHRQYKSFMIFFMTHILQQSLQAPLPSDILFVMAAKISRRILKLGIGEEPPWMPYVHKTIEAAHLELGARWSMIEQNPDPLGIQGGWNPSELSFYRDTRLSISTLRPYLAGIANRDMTPSGHGTFTSGCQPRIKLHSSTFPQFQLPMVDAVRLFLADLELWVEDSLDIWLRANWDSPSTCTCLAELIKNYTTTATSTYAGNPEDASLMLLTSMDLWVALDKCATRNESLLILYDPGFPPSLFAPLLLPKKSQMLRLARVEQHLMRRGNKSVYGSSLIFQDINAEGSLAVQYFDQSLRHQDLRREIEAAAEIERDRKKLELMEQCQQYNRLKRQSDGMSCEDIKQWSGRRQISYHDPGRCPRCRVKDSAERLQIDVHEWPLPTAELEARSAVFELDVPIAIAKWRDITYTLLVDVISPPTLSNSQRGNTIYYLHEVSGYVRFQTGRLQLASTAKPFTVAHYRTKKIPLATKENVCVPHGLRYSMYDSASIQLTAELLDRCDIRNLCTFQLPSGHYGTLQYALDGTTHSSNEVLAAQAECPKGLNLHEFYAFATLRSGDRLQWRNIARELVAQILNFHHEETYMLVVQTAWQAGRPGDDSYLRESHVDLDEEEFGRSLLSVLGEALGTVEGNWQGAVAVRSFVALAIRLLSVSTCDKVLSGCYLFLRRARQVTLEWTRDVGQLLHEAEGVEELKIFNLRVLEMALTCHGTFNVDKDHLSALLNSEDDVAVVTECLIIVHDRCPAVTDCLPRVVKTMLERHERLCHLLEPILSEKILADRRGIDSTLRRVWAGYCPGLPWTTVESPSERWLVTETSTEGGSSPMIVHYNILDGSLLVKGLPLTRLPPNYELHCTYRRLFGEKVLEVIPSEMPGMLFATQKKVWGQQMHFRMCGPELIIRTRQAEQVCELLPIHSLHDDFPAAFVEDYAHWLDIDTGVVEWRPLRHAWTSSPDNWQMRGDGQEVGLSRGAKRLVDIRSPTAKAISRILGPLEHATYIHVILNCETEALEVKLPRVKLDFSLQNHGNLLVSKQYRGMVVDECQSFGSLTGLANKLVLREVKGSSRSVIVPHGRVSFSRDGYHVRVKIDTTLAAHVNYHSYDIDTELGRLVDNGNLRSRLFRLYLHATTAHCLIDQLTGRTGTEEALHGLASAATRSFVELEPGDVEILRKLARLTPRRQYYPEHLRVMQQTEWATLSPLSQHCAFSTQVASIFNQAKSFHVFREQPAEQPNSDTRGDHDLLERAAIRYSSFQTYSFGAEAYTTDHDITYCSRDQVLNGARELQTCRTTKLVDNWSTNLTICPRLLFEIESWSEPILGPGLADNSTLDFDPKWVDLPAKEFLPDGWCTLQSTLSRSVVENDKYKILIFLGSLSYSRHANQELVQTLLALATIPELRIIQPPDCPVFRLDNGYKPDRETLTKVIGEHVRQFYECPEYDLPNLIFELQHTADERRRKKHEVTKEEKIRSFVEELMAQWPQANISAPSDPNHGTYILVDEATASARVWFQSWYRNAQFQRYAQRVQNILNGLAPESQNLEQYSFSPPVDEYVSTRTHINFEDLTSNPAPRLLTADQGDFDEWIVPSNKENTDHAKLRELLAHVSAHCSSGHEQRYASDLFKSYEALREDKSVELNLPPESTELLEAHLMRARRYVKTVYQIICSQLQIGHDLLRIAQMLPRISRTSILLHLSNDKVAALPDGWKRCLVVFGRAIAALQRAERLVASHANLTELLSELENPGHLGWDPMRHPEWLLLEIENNIHIRAEQAQIAREMMSPSSGCNSVMQLNMGLGKSSVIVPIAAAALADVTRLVRVVVLKPLAMQMFHLLAKKLGGMLNRRIFYMPISRSLKLDVLHARQIHELYQECMRVGGILLIQPEHILSFELMGIEQVLSGKTELGNVMIRTQDWLRVNSRDILDESDEIVSVRFELIYTMGMQRAIEFSPDRWAIIQHVLGLLGHYAHEVNERFEHGLEVVSAQPGGFPRIRILQTLAGDELLKIVARQLCETGLPGVPVSYLPAKVRTALFQFLTDPLFSTMAMQLLQEAAFGSDTVRNGLLLLMGLFAGGILRFALEQKRWRVNYGLDHSRTMLAVPYHAKDSPAARAEFSHPDATIVLTCLSYYYGGLSDQQIYASFDALLQSDHAPEEYARWVQDAPKLPTAFRHVAGINLSNTGQCTREVFPPLRFAKGLINFYMSTIVFPAEMKEFTHKLSSSGWDIAREKTHPTTGFSGTNDSRYVLPLSISQGDLPPQLSTNAKVLDCLLRPENSFAGVIQSSDAGVLDADALLKMALALNPPVRVILDVGAQVLEMENEEMARDWLSRVSESTAQAVIFFDTRNEICVLSRDGTTEPLLISPFAKQMDQCLVYLDEVHTRGTDLRMPANYRAIVTLGPGLTKDRLAQACMRMRKLGKGQSIVFCAPMEVHRKILESSGKSRGAIEVADVLTWCIASTCTHTRKCIPLWATQGVRYQRRHVACSQYWGTTEGDFPRHVAASMLEEEAQSLQQRYGGEGTQREEQLLSENDVEGQLLMREEQLADIRAKCREFGVASFSTAALQEEQERELSPETEREQQVELPQAATPCNHSVHQDVRQLITHGVLERSSNAFRPAFQTLRNTTAYACCEIGAWPDDLLVTADFAQTVQAPADEMLDSFLRPVHWVVSCKKGDRVESVVLSPYETQELLPSVRQSKHVILHVYSPRFNVSMCTLEDLSFCAIPAVPESWSTPSIATQLNLFAGQLYIRTYEEYERLCGFLGLCSEPPDDYMEVACDGFITPPNRPKSDIITAPTCPFMMSPVAFLRILMAMRRKGQSCTTSHFGRILNGELISREHF